MRPSGPRARHALGGHVALPDTPRCLKSARARTALGAYDAYRVTVTPAVSRCPDAVASAPAGDAIRRSLADHASGVITAGMPAHGAAALVNPARRTPSARALLAHGQG